MQAPTLRVDRKHRAKLVDKLAAHFASLATYLVAVFKISRSMVTRVNACLGRLSQRPEQLLHLPGQSVRSPLICRHKANLSLRRNVWKRLPRNARARVVKGCQVFFADRHSIRFWKNNASGWSDCILARPVVGRAYSGCLRRAAR
jgi:hypothetical protein